MAFNDRAQPPLVVPHDDVRRTPAGVDAVSGSDVEKAAEIRRRALALAGSGG
ncbi:hypothetical protein [Kitasatospora sp. NPDC001683]